MKGSLEGKGVSSEREAESICACDSNSGVMRGFLTAE